MDETEIVSEIRTDGAAQVAADVVQTVNANDAAIVNAVVESAAVAIEQNAEILEDLEECADEQELATTLLSSLSTAVAEMRESMLAQRETQARTLELLTELMVRQSTVIPPSIPQSSPEAPVVAVVEPESVVVDLPVVDAPPAQAKRPRKI